MSSLDHMKDLVSRYLEPTAPMRVVDVGSFDVNGSYRPIFDRPGWQYIGVDIAAGPNVDMVLSSPYRFPMRNSFADLVISGQAFEHIEFFWLTWKEMVRVTKPGGLIFLIAPSRGPEHLHPVDCWRFLPGGYRALAKLVRNAEVVEVQTDWQPHSSPDSADWGDTVGVFRKSAARPLFLRPLDRLVRGPR